VTTIFYESPNDDPAFICGALHLAQRRETWKKIENLEK
jgi:hypothetical protein